MALNPEDDPWVVNARLRGYFGEPWPSGVCEGQRFRTPVGEECAFCGELITDEDRGSFIGALDLDGRAIIAPIHRECSLRSVLGGIGHLTNHQRWCGEEHDPDAGLGRRMSSVLVWEWVQEHGLP